LPPCVPRGLYIELNKLLLRPRETKLLTVKALFIIMIALLPVIPTVLGLF